MQSTHRKSGFAPIVAVVLAAAGLAGYVVAGPVDPPAGPIVSSYKTLDQVEPRIPVSAATTPGNFQSSFIISAPGSYYLTANVLGESGKDGILIAASNVTLDLNGFSLTGVANSDTGIVASSGLTQVVIRNGTVRSWGFSGINVTGATEATIEGISSCSNGAAGISFLNGAVIRRCITSHNGQKGISGFHHCTVADVVSTFNGGTGVDVGNNCVIRNVNASENTGSGIESADDCVITDSEIAGNDVHGIDAGWRTVVSGSHLYGNASHGVMIGGQSRITGNTIDSNGVGGIGCGVYVTPGGQSATVADNLICNNDIGVQVDATSCFVLRNFVRANTSNISVVGGNVVGPYSTGATISTLTNPSANFTN